MLTRLVLNALPLVPRPLMRRMASRYIAGERLEHALQRLEGLAARGYPGILDVLGEGLGSEAASRAAADEYLHAADALARARLDCYVSIKPTHLGLSCSEQLALELYSRIAARCAGLGLKLRVEMEDSPTVAGTLRVFAALHQRHENVGLVLQSRLLRTPADIAALPPGPLDVRLVKGIYLEPPAIAHTEDAPISAAYVECVRLLAARGAFLALATHDDALAQRCLEVLAERGYERGQYEFQVLMGVREEFWARWRAAGHSVRVYVPYGREWRAYSLRRMRANPTILRHVIRRTLHLD